MSIYRSPEVLPQGVDPQPPPSGSFGTPPALSARWGGEGFALPPQTPPPEVYEGLRPSNSPKVETPLLCAPDVVPAVAFWELKI